MDIPAKLKHLMRNFCYFAVFSSEINIKLTTEVALQVQRHTQHSIFLQLRISFLIIMHILWPLKSQQINKGTESLMVLAFCGLCVMVLYGRSQNIRYKVPGLGVRLISLCILASSLARSSWPWSNSLLLLSLSFHICKKGLTSIELVSYGCIKNYHKFMGLKQHSSSSSQSCRSKGQEQNEWICSGSHKAEITVTCWCQLSLIKKGIVYFICFQ